MLFPPPKDNNNKRPKNERFWGWFFDGASNSVIAAIMVTHQKIEIHLYEIYFYFGSLRTKSNTFLCTTHKSYLPLQTKIPQTGVPVVRRQSNNLDPPPPWESKSVIVFGKFLRQLLVLACMVKRETLFSNLTCSGAASTVVTWESYRTVLYCTTIQCTLL